MDRAEEAQPDTQPEDGGIPPEAESPGEGGSEDAGTAADPVADGTMAIPDDGRGRHANSPSEIPRKGWRDIAFRVWDEIGADNVSLVAAGVAFYMMLAIFPGITALISMYGLAFNPLDVASQINAVRMIMPAEAFAILDEQLTRLTTAEPASLSLGLVIGLLFTLWSAMGGVKGFLTAMNIAYEEKEKRGFFRVNLIAFLITLGAIAFVILALVLVVALPAVLGLIGLDWMAESLVSLLRWPVLAAAVMFGLSALYRYGPSRHKAQWQWVTWGAAIATTLWLAGSLLFSWYIANFNSYDRTYGSVGAVVILLMWFYLTAFVVLVGAEINAEIEHQTARDSTTGPPKPMGERRAKMADTLGQPR